MQQFSDYAAQAQLVDQKYRNSPSSNLQPLWQKVSRDYEVIQLIGSGSFGEVVLGKQRSTNKMVAIKLIQNSFNDEYQSKKILSEIQILRQLSTMKSNVFTTKLIDVVAPQNIDKMNYIFIVMEHVDSDLKKVFGSSRNIEFNEEHVITILYNTLCAMQFLHSAGIMHRDIKPANILVDVECQVKLCDFGLSRTVPYDQLLIPSQVMSSAGNMSPQRKIGVQHRALSNRSMAEGGTFGKRNSTFKSPSRYSSKMNVYSQPSSGENSKGERRSPQKIAKFDKAPILISSITSRKQMVAEALIADRSKRQKQTRCLSNHITSRWYRPPEIIMVEKNYDTAVDMWSMGCVFAEMLYCTDVYKAENKNLENRFLFPGSSCFPLSPCEQMAQNSDKNVNIVSQNDQLKKILDQLGYQDDSDLSFITDDSALDYHKSLCTKTAKGSFKKLFSKTSDGLVDILTGMLEYNPCFRMTAAECLKSKVFDSIRVPQFEKPAPFQVQQKIYQAGSYDYEECVSKKYKIKDFKMMISDEIRAIKTSNGGALSQKDQRQFQLPDIVK